MSKYILDIIFVIITIGFFSFSYHKGFIKVIGDLVSWIIAIIGSAFTYEYIFAFLKFTKNSYKPLVFCITFIVFLIILEVIFRVISSGINKTKVLGGINKFFGGVCGLIQALILIVIITIIMCSFFVEYTKGSYVIKYTNEILNKFIK